jgi:hypothetical protein
MEGASCSCPSWRAVPCPSSRAELPDDVARRGLADAEAVRLLLALKRRERVRRQLRLELAAHSLQFAVVRTSRLRGGRDAGAGLGHGDVVRRVKYARRA